MVVGCPVSFRWRYDWPNVVLMDENNLDWWYLTWTQIPSSSSYNSASNENNFTCFPHISPTIGAFDHDIYLGSTVNIASNIIFLIEKIDRGHIQYHSTLGLFPWYSYSYMAWYWCISNYILHVGLCSHLKCCFQWFIDAMRYNNWSINW